MRLDSLHGKPHLAYGLNVHPGETLEDLRRVLAGPVTAVRDRVAPGRPFGLGMRWSAPMVAELAADPAALADFRRLLEQQNFYAFTVNVFPYGRFHGGAVKEQVYAPDWRTAERLAYTTQAADLLAALLPDDGTEGSLSTVPGSFLKWMSGPEDVSAIISNLTAAARHLDELRCRTGRVIRLALEPEPACFMETTLDVLTFFEHLLGAGDEALIREYVGICLDTCHLGVAGESVCHALDALAGAGIRVPKIQISAAPIVENTPAGRGQARRFDEPVYLHQTRAFLQGRRVARWTDLPEALASLEAGASADEFRIHAHVPLFWEGAAPLRSTSSELSPAFWPRLAGGVSSHLEIETYTFHVLPPEFRDRPIDESVAREYAWVLSRLGA